MPTVRNTCSHCGCTRNVLKMRFVPGVRMFDDAWMCEKGGCVGTRRKYRYRSAITGEYVTRWYALLHPGTTVKERI